MLAVLIVSAAAFFVGRSMASPARDRVAVVEKGAIVLEAVLARPGASQEVIDAEVRQPILGVLKKYVDQGYTVIDASRDDDGNLQVAALPGDALDITGEMRQAVHLEPLPSAPAVSSASAASAPGQTATTKGGRHG